MSRSFTYNGAIVYRLGHQVFILRSGVRLPVALPFNPNFQIMKRLILSLACVLSLSANALEVYALGTSNTNCKNANQSYTRRLGELLADTAQVTNGGEDGDKPIWMLRKIKNVVDKNPNIRLVIFEPGPNERSVEYNLRPSAEILDYLRSKNVTVIYVSNNVIQNPQEAKDFADGYGAYYYGPWTRGIPVDREHRLYDQGAGPGHMTVKGCEIWAEQMAPLVRRAIKEKHLE